MTLRQLAAWIIGLTILVWLGWLLIDHLMQSKSSIDLMIAMLIPTVLISCLWLYRYWSAFDEQ